MDTETCMDDLDGVIRQMSTLGTENKEDLVKKMQMYTSHQLNTQGCCFFLEMNNWNLQGAIGSYYDSINANYATNPLQASLVRDITIGDGEAVPLNTQFVKTWRIKNSGQVGWPPSCSLRYVTGHKMEAPDFVLVGGLEPGDEMNISVSMKSPSYQGVYQSQWRMQTPTGTLFGAMKLFLMRILCHLDDCRQGRSCRSTWSSALETLVKWFLDKTIVYLDETETIWVIIHVSPDGLLDVTQRMSQFGAGELGQPLAPVCNDYQRWLPHSSESSGQDTSCQSDPSSIFSFHNNDMPPSDGPKDTDMS